MKPKDRVDPKTGTTHAPGKYYRPLERFLPQLSDASIHAVCQEQISGLRKKTKGKRKRKGKKKHESSITGTTAPLLTAVVAAAAEVATASDMAESEETEKTVESIISDKSKAKGNAKANKPNSDSLKVDAALEELAEGRTNTCAKTQAPSMATLASSKKHKRNNKKKRNAQKHACQVLQNLLDTYITIHAPNGCIIEDKHGVPLIVLVRYIFAGNVGEDINVSCQANVVYK
jgi:hypothetical protein